MEPDLMLQRFLCGIVLRLLISKPLSPASPVVHVDCPQADGAAVGRSTLHGRILPRFSKTCANDRYPKFHLRKDVDARHSACRRSALLKAEDRFPWEGFPSFLAVPSAALSDGIGRNLCS